VLTGDLGAAAEERLERADASDPAPTPEAALIAEAEAAEVRQAVAELPVPFREILVLREIHELDYRAISEIAQVPIGTVMSRLARARRLLIATLQRGEP
jgi:RNA polymerase sigma-70 factor (ECF subfamily)